MQMLMAPNFLIREKTMKKFSRIWMTKEKFLTVKGKFWGSLKKLTTIYSSSLVEMRASLKEEKNYNSHWPLFRKTKSSLLLKKKRKKWLLITQ